jgi:proteasome lid subunit RPN8/RPN11
MPTRHQRQWRRNLRTYDHPRRKRRRRRASNRTAARPKLRFTPTAWAKLLHLRDLGATEVGGFGITPADDLLLVEKFLLVQQSCSEITVAFDDAAVADFFEEQVDEGRQPEQFARIWLHTHPGSSAAPSHVDEETFQRVFGRCDWAVMFILARGGQARAELSWPQGGGSRIRLDVGIDYTRPFEASDHDAWKAEYDASVHPEHQWFTGNGLDWDVKDPDAGDLERPAGAAVPPDNQSIMTEDP